MTEDTDLVSAVVEAFIEARARGEPVEAADVEKRHPSLAPELGERLRALGEIDDCFALLRGAQPEAPPVPPLPGYRILGTLGRGALGAVYLAEQQALKRLVALKALGPAADDRARERFRREASTVARLSHPCIVPVHEVEETAGWRFLSTELVIGLDLAGVVRGLRESGGAPSGLQVRRLVRDRAAWLAAAARRHGARFSATEADERFWGSAYPDFCATVIRDVAGALAFSHAHGIVHRDVKPSNIVLGIDGRCRLIDFGLMLEPESAVMTAATDFIGTAAYASPEQVSGDAHALGPQSDVFSLGAVLYELLSLKRAFGGATVAEVLDRVSHGAPPEPEGAGFEVPADLAAVCAQALRKDLRKRYRDAGLLRDDLSRFLERRPVLARRHPSLARAVLAFMLVASLAAGILRVTRARPSESIPSPAVEVEVARAPSRPAERIGPGPIPIASEWETAYALLAAGQTAQAATLLQDAVGRNATDLRLRLLYAEALRRSGDVAGSERQFGLCVALDPDNRQALEGLAAVLALRGRLEPSVEVYKKIAAMDPADAETFVILGELSATLGRTDEAAYFNTKAAELKKQ